MNANTSKSIEKEIIQKIIDGSKIMAQNTMEQCGEIWKIGVMGILDVCVKLTVLDNELTELLGKFKL